MIVTLPPLHPLADISHSDMPWWIAIPAVLVALAVFGWLLDLAPRHPRRGRHRR